MKWSENDQSEKWSNLVMEYRPQRRVHLKVPLKY